MGAVYRPRVDDLLSAGRPEVGTDPGRHPELSSAKHRTAAGAGPAVLACATIRAQLTDVIGGVPSRHSPRCRPVPEPAISYGAAAARAWSG
jgi:hypothetical protein